MAGIPPQQTLYINNLNDKIQKDELKKNLYLIFSQYGPVMDIVATKVPRMRGQAFVTMKDVTQATIALRQLQGMFVFEKPMRIQYGKTKADVVARLDGTYSAKKKRERREKIREQEREKERQKFTKRDAPSIADRDSKRRRIEDVRQAERARELEREREKQQRQAEEKEVPHTTLFVSNLPNEAVENPEMLAVLFQGYEGFKEVRVPPASDQPIAFVDFESPLHAKEAKLGLQGFKITYEHSMEIKYAKK